MKITTADGYVSTLGAGTEVDAETESAITTAIDLKPIAENGYGYRLKADTIEWEYYKLPEPAPIDDELTAEEALDIITGGAE